MTKDQNQFRCSLALTLAAALAATAADGQPTTPSSRTSMSELLTLVGEVTALDVATRTITLRGPLGGEVTGKVAPEVKNLPQVKVGDLVTTSYYSSLAVSAHKKGEPNPLFTGGDVTTAEAGKRPAGHLIEQTKATVTVVAVDTKARTLTVSDEQGDLFTTDVIRPEFVAKLANLKPGDQLDLVLTEALFLEVTKAAPGAKPSVGREVTTLIIDRGEVVRRNGSTLFVRNERGRMVKVAVDPDFKFQLNGKEATVFDLEPGDKLARTAFRVVDSTYYEEK